MFPKQFMKSLKSALCILYVLKYFWSPAWNAGLPIIRCIPDVKIVMVNSVIENQFVF